MTAWCVVQCIHLWYIERGNCDLEKIVRTSCEVVTEDGLSISNLATRGRFQTKIVIITCTLHMIGCANV
jgi:hypothetical protein